MSVEDISSDLISLKSISNLQASNFKIIYDSNANINKTTVSLQLDSSQVNIDIINVTGNVSFGAQFQGLKISLENDNKIQLNVFKCHVDLNFYMITPHSTLKIWQYFVSQAMLKSFIHFNLVEPTNIIASRFPVHSILNHGISPQHVQFYVHSTNDINYMSEYMSNLVHFDLKNSNANFILANLSYLQYLNASNSNITFNNVDKMNFMIFSTKLSNSNIYTGENNVLVMIDLDFYKSNYYGNYYMMRNFRFTGGFSYFQNVTISEFISITFAGHSSAMSLQIDNFHDGSEKYFNFNIKSSTKYYRNIICSKQKNFMQKETMKFIDSDTIKFYDILYHESENEGNYCIDLNRTDDGNYKEHLKLCFVDSFYFCPDNYIIDDNLQKYHPNESSIVDIYISNQSVHTIDLSDCHQDVRIEWENAELDKLDLNIKGTSFKSLKLIGINAYFNNDINIGTVSLIHSDIYSNFSVSVTEMKFDTYSDFRSTNYTIKGYELLNYSPKNISFENDGIIIDDRRFRRSQTITIDNNLPWITEINLNSQSPGNVFLKNNHPNSVIIIDSRNSSAVESLRIDPCGTVAFRDVAGKIPINFTISSETQFIIPENFSVEFDQIEIMNPLNLLLDNNIKVSNIKISQAGRVIGGTLNTHDLYLDSSDYLNVGTFSADNINFSENAFARLTYNPDESGNIIIPFNSSSIPYIEMDLQESKKGEIEFVATDTQQIAVSSSIKDFKVIVLKLSKSKCKNWKTKISSKSTFDIGSIIDTSCVIENKQAVFYLVKKQNMKTWLKIVIIISSVVGFILLVTFSVCVYAKIKRRIELKYLNRIYDEQSESRNSEHGDDIDF
ncbi:hypothetical protein TVAG_102760 [Trichomonas vaginalis G3]|uniref:Uncharacterized protein n=1 Tax=Trichomonas vaginalis (strain ATCC PRA-98 / G3) TaxID=412133 RepID=A2ECY2_TRIV3|nr:hypothetical protein TVAGG3_0757770 [Trichomonas vaginalis G3]EAY09527.1 hypothetical protein TVAG_102760 [Trichomonas vaginalis G3]KAI5512988.1 hypothetical protein TVAGG3_0757770 [Trichomonas vaginalis G3]|eukprot:XP_001321750.1 hypothetical protein [Trichomonas vaginalis G3]